MRKNFIHVIICFFLIISFSGIQNVEAAYKANDTEQIFGKNKNKSSKKKYLTHIVNHGESLLSILNRYGLPLSVFMSDNPQVKENGIIVGQQLNISRKDMNSATLEQIEKEVSLMSIPKENSKNKDVKEDVAVKEKVVVKELQDSVDEGSGDEISQGFIEHKVLKGETLFSLARSHNTTVPELRALNSEVLVDGLKEGTIIKLPSDNVSSLEKDKNVNVDYDKIVGMRSKNRDFSKSPINISLLLPLTDAGKRSPQFAEFYQGFLIALDSLKKDGVSTDLKLFDTQKSKDKVISIINSGELNSSDLIIGPVYEDEFCEVAKFASKINVPIVSPLAVVSCSNPVVFQMAPDESTKYDKIASFIKDKKVILYKGSNEDKEFVDKIMSLSAGNVTMLSFDPKADPENIGTILESGKESVFIVAAETEQLMDAMLSKLSAIKKSSHAPKPMSVLTTSKITKMSSLDPSYFFLLNLRYVSSYHIDRTNKDVMGFDNKYIDMFHKIPSLYSYRGYDAGMFFVDYLKLLSGDFCNYINNYKVTMLQSKYHFNRKNNHDSFKNTEWMMINYTSSYNIIIN